MREDFSAEKFLQFHNAMRFLNRLQSEQEEKEKRARAKGKIICLHCGAIVRVPKNKKDGSKRIYSCFNCGCKYFESKPVDVVEILLGIAEKAGVSLDELEVETYKDFQCNYDNSAKSPEEIKTNMYFVTTF